MTFQANPTAWTPQAHSNNAWETSTELGFAVLGIYVMSCKRAGKDPVKPPQELSKYLQFKPHVALCLNLKAFDFLSSNPLEPHPKNQTNNALLIHRKKPT